MHGPCQWVTRPGGSSAKFWGPLRAISQSNNINYINTLWRNEQALMNDATLHVLHICYARSMPLEHSCYVHIRTLQICYLVVGMENGVYMTYTLSIVYRKNEL